jgi:hypothetical protein
LIEVLWDIGVAIWAWEKPSSSKRGSLETVEESRLDTVDNIAGRSGPVGFACGVFQSFGPLSVRGQGLLKTVGSHETIEEVLIDTVDNVARGS